MQAAKGHDPDLTGPEALGQALGLNRRQFLAATTGMAAAVALGPGALTAAAQGQGQGKGPSGVLVPPAKRGIILYSVRDVVSRNPLTSDPSLPAGFQQLFEVLGRIGYKQVEFAGYNQNANAPGGNVNNVAGAHLLRTWLDDNGLEAEGNHGSIPGSITPTTLASFDTACEQAAILGMGHIGTGSDPTGSAYKADWDAAAERWNILGERAMTNWGLKLYTHNHDAAYNFLLDSGPLDALGRPTRSSGVRRLEYFLTQTNPDYVWLEMDIYWAHVAQHRWHTFTAPDGAPTSDVFDPLAIVQDQTIRYPLFHAKDGRRDDTVTNGYVMTPLGQGDIDYGHFFANMGAKGYHNPMWEQDTAPGGNAAPNQSLDFAAVSYDHMASLRG